MFFSVAWASSVRPPPKVDIGDGDVDDCRLLLLLGEELLEGQRSKTGRWTSL